MNPFQIAVDPQKWGLNKPADVRRHIPTIKLVLECTSGQIAVHCIDGFMPDILAEYDKTGPVCHHARDARNRVRIGLNTTYNLWAQQAYQFAHEFCHAVANHTRDGQEHNLRHSNKWVEEAICHAASFFSLRRLSSEWENDPRLTALSSSYSASLRSHAESIVRTATLLLPLSENFVAWFAECEPELRAHPVARVKDDTLRKRLRGFYDIIAVRLLPLFEANPINWSSLSFLNVTPTTEADSLESFLKNWKESCPNDVQLPQQVAAVFEISL